MTKLIDTPKCLLVEVPEGAEKFETSIQDDGIPCLTYWYKDNLDPTVICLPPGTYGQPILASEMGDKQLDDLLEVWLSMIERISGKSMLEFHNLQPSTTVVIPKTI